MSLFVSICILLVCSAITVMSLRGILVNIYEL